MATAVAGLGTMEPKRQWANTAERNSVMFEAQRRQRRGPTPEVFFTKHIDNSRIVKADDPERRRDMRRFMTAMLSLFLVVMVYVGQHLSSIETGYSIESQKQQMLQLEEQNRQLRLSEAQLSDPGRIDTIAKQLGLDTPLPGQVIQTNGDFNTNANAPALAQVAPAPLAVK